MRNRFSNRVLFLFTLCLCVTTVGTGSVPAVASTTSKYLVKNQQAQTTSYYCGPAAVAEALGALGTSISQSSAANLLKTTTDGTAWSGVNAKVTSPTGYPVPDVMNYKWGKLWYVPVAVPDPARSSDVTTYIERLQFDINDGAPLLGDAVEVAGGPHLVGHPTNKNIFHWFEIRGYSSSGSNTAYEDSVHGASSISWSASVPAYSELSSSTIVHIVGGRGYVW